MEIKIKTAEILGEKSDAAIITVFEGDKPKGVVADADRATGGALCRAQAAGEFTGKAGETLTLPIKDFSKDAPARIMFAGLGTRDKFKADTLRRTAGKAASVCRNRGFKEVTALVADTAGLTPSESARLWAEGSALALYSYDTFKTPDPKKKELKRLTLITSDRAAEAAIRKGSTAGAAIAEAVCFARDMINAPANEMTPTHMAECAKKTAKEFGLKYKALEAGDCKKLGMGSYLGVSLGSVQPPKFIILEYNGGKKGAKPTVIVGKGITFDSGGISIKPSEGMEKMKYDMAGGAGVIGAIRAVAALKLPVNLVALVPASENLPSGSALKPGDVVRAMNGKTIEIISTDAEGRLVLADALCYAARYKPEAVIDIATLTGACVIALGDLAIGMMGNNAELIAKVRDAAEASSERVWELPMWDEYLERMKGDVTDLKNVGGRQAATVTAGKFLQEFVGADMPWVHLDIAGTAWEEKGQPYIPKGARGTGVRLLVEYFSPHPLPLSPR